MGDVNKIFGVGMFKTGTTTLGVALMELGFSCYNGPWKNPEEFPYDPWNLNPEIYTANKQSLIQKVEKFDAFQDYPFMYAYEALDEWFPNSKFILTTRDPESLAVSDRKMWIRQELAVESEIPSPSQFIERYENHYNAVTTYFKSRPEDLLEVSWFDGDSWEKLCEFLEVPVPLKPFPVANSAKPAGENLLRRAMSKFSRMFR